MSPDQVTAAAKVDPTVLVFDTNTWLASYNVFFGR